MVSMLKICAAGGEFEVRELLPEHRAGRRAGKSRAAGAAGAGAPAGACGGILPLPARRVLRFSGLVELCAAGPDQYCVPRAHNLAAVDAVVQVCDTVHACSGCQAT